MDILQKVAVFPVGPLLRNRRDTQALSSEVFVQHDKVFEDLQHAGLPVHRLDLDLEDGEGLHVLIQERLRALHVHMERCRAPGGGAGRRHVGSRDHRECGGGGGKGVGSMTEDNEERGAKSRRNLSSGLFRVCSVRLSPPHPSGPTALSKREEAS